MQINLDTDTADDADLETALAYIAAEKNRRDALALAEERIDSIVREVRIASGESDSGTEPVEWVQPTGAHDAYPLGWIVLHGGKVWENITPANVWEPGVSGWRERVVESDDLMFPEWVQPSGAHDSYAQGELVTYEGKVWRSIMDGNVWAPGAHGWVPAE